jgi:DnaJ-domain-containing protein 1
METAPTSLFAFGLAFAVGTWLRSHLFLACLVGLGVAAPFAAAVKAGDLLAPLVVAVVGAVCGAFREELSPVWAWCRRSSANAASSGFNRATGGRFRTAGADGPGPDSGPEPERRQESFFGGGPTAEERANREAERANRERANEQSRESGDDRWKRDNEERDRKERQEAEAAEKTKREEQARQEREREAAAKARREREERARREREGASGPNPGSGGGAGDDEAKSRYRPPPGSGDIEAALAVLGVSASASPQAVKKAYRRMAKRWHPDMNQGSKEAEEAFKKVQAAYEALHAAGKAA